jgi:hypothetical protein
MTGLDLEAMNNLAKTDEGMADLMSKAFEYYMLKGRPGYIERIEQDRIATLKANKVMNAIYGSNYID